MAAFVTFHVEHIRAKQHRGTDDPSNLALACPDCNAFKGPNLTTFAPDTDEQVPVFNPRLHDWDEHFELRGSLILGLTSIAQGTVALLQMNDDARLDMRKELISNGDY